MASRRKSSRRSATIQAIQNSKPVTPEKTQQTEDDSAVMVGQSSTCKEKVDYIMNKTKAMTKKILAANRPNIEYDITGGGHRVKLSAGTYEIVKDGFEELFNKSDLYRVEVRDRIEGSGSTVDHTLSVFDTKNDDKLYVVNMYNTTSLILTNGAKPTLFQEHLEEVLANADHDKEAAVNQLLQSINESAMPRRSNREKKPTAKVIQGQKSIKPPSPSAQNISAPAIAPPTTDQITTKPKKGKKKETKSKTPKESLKRRKSKTPAKRVKSNIIVVADMVTPPQQQATGGKSTYSEPSPDKEVPVPDQRETGPEATKGVECPICEDDVMPIHKSRQCKRCLDIVHKSCDAADVTPYACPSCIRNDKEETALMKAAASQPAPKSNPPSNKTPVPEKLVDVEKALKAKEKDLKQWEKKLKKQAEDLSDVTQKLAASRVQNEKATYEIDQLKKTTVTLQATIDQLQVELRQSRLTQTQPQAQAPGSSHLPSAPHPAPGYNNSGTTTYAINPLPHQQGPLQLHVHINIPEIRTRQESNSLQASPPMQHIAHQQPAHQQSYNMPHRQVQLSDLGINHQYPHHVPNPVNPHPYAQHQVPVMPVPNMHHEAFLQKQQAFLIQQQAQAQSYMQRERNHQHWRRPAEAWKAAPQTSKVPPQPASQTLPTTNNRQQSAAEDICSLETNQTGAAMKGPDPTCSTQSKDTPACLLPDTSTATKSPRTASLLPTPTGRKDNLPENSTHFLELASLTTQKRN